MMRLSMNKQATECWALVVDGGRARILQLNRQPPKIRELKSLESSSLHAGTRDLVSDAGGRSFNVKGPASHSKFQHISAAEIASQHFVRCVVKYLEKAANSGALDKLLLVADPKTLGRLRAYMNRMLSGKVIAESNHDLVGLPLRDLEKRLRNTLGWSV